MIQTFTDRKKINLSYHLQIEGFLGVGVYLELNSNNSRVIFILIYLWMLSFNQVKVIPKSLV